MNRKEKLRKRSNKKCELNTISFIDKNSFNLFCEICSIRGMHKITKAPTVFLKILWIAFVFCMTTMLFLVTGLLIKDYLNYYTAWHVRTKFDDDSEFPAITLCSHNPFSLQANNLWKKPNAFSPYAFRERIKKLVINQVNGSDVFSEIKLLTFHDKIETYYSNIEYDYSVKISHGFEMLRYCAIALDGNYVITKNCDKGSQINVEKKLFSNQKFFNCWTIEKRSDAIQGSASSIIILVSLTPAADLPELKEAFFMDMLERGEGLRLVIHEPNSYPEIEEEGIDVQPGKMNNIKYEPVKWARHSTPPQICKNGQPQMVDLQRTFNYSFTFCMNYNLQLELIKTCGCMNAMFPKPYLPNAKIGYCVNLTHENVSKIEANIKCAGNFMKNIKSLKKNWENTKCMQRCDYFTYNTELSITKWVPSYEKLLRLAALINKTESYLDEIEPKEEYISYLQSNISNANLKSDVHFMDFENENKFTYISLTRKTRNTVIKDEELVLDLAILMSRIGGLCSLFIGLTVSFFIELVEFGYLICWRRNHMRKAAKSSIRINSNQRQICESNNSVYDIPTVNIFEKNIEDNCEEKIDFIKESKLLDLPESKSTVAWGNTLDSLE